MTQRLHSLRITLGFALLFAISSAAQAIPLFSNFGAGYSYQTGAGLLVGDGNLDGSANYAQASTFTTNATANLGTIVLALSDFGFGQTDTISISLRDSGSNLPGSNVLETFTIAANTLGVLGNNNLPLVLNSVLNPLLTVGTQYWLTISTSLTNIIVWNFSDTDFANYNVESQSLDGGMTWDLPFGNTRGVFEINAAVVQVPEPATLALLLSGAFGVVGFRRRRLVR